MTGTAVQLADCSTRLTLSLCVQNAASREELPQNLRFFNKTHEIWVGRVAMLGLTGLGLVETFITKGALFHRG